jgi:hypothetical protein
MVRAPSQVSAELNEVRETIGLRLARPAKGRTTPGQAAPSAPVPYPSVVRRGGYPAGWLGRRIRQLVGAVTAVSGGVALTHQILAGALAPAGGPWGAAAALLAWPVPLLQPVLAGVGALILCAVGAMTGGWRHIGPRQGWLLLAGAVAAILGAGPMVVVCALTAVVCLLAVVVGLVISFCLLALLLR